MNQDHKKNLTISDIHDITEFINAGSQIVNGSLIIQKINGSTLSKEGLLLLQIIIQKIQPEVIIEFGCGLSTEVINDTIYPNKECRFFSIDNIEKFINCTQSALNKPNCVTFIHAPIKLHWIDGCPFVTYSGKFLSELCGIDSVDLVLIDGPYGKIFTREAPLFLISGLLKEGSVVILDDSNRPKEQQTLKIWKQVFGEAVEMIEIPGFPHGIAVILVKSRLPRVSFRMPYRVGKIAESCKSLWENRKYMKTVNNIK